MGQITVESLLQSLGPSRSSMIVDHLVQKGITRGAARKRASRSTIRIRRLSGISLRNREAFLYLAEQFNTPEFWKNLLDALNSTNSCYGYAAHALIARRAVRPSQFACISGAPRHLRNHVPPDTILAGLRRIQFCSDEHDPHPWISVLPYIETSDRHHIAPEVRNRVERILLDGVSEWLRRMGFVSFNKVKARSDSGCPNFSSFDWDLVGPSYLSSMTHRTENGAPKPGFFVADICLTSELTPQEVGYFLNKCRVARNLRNTRPFLAMLLADSFTPQALRLGKEAGLIFATPDDFFGNGTRAAVRSLLTTLEKATEVAAKNPEALAKILDGLGRIEGAALNVRGALFELIVAHAVKQIEGGQIDVGRLVYSPTHDQHAEIDVLNWKSRQSLLAIECKGHSPASEVSNGEVGDWLTRQVPRFYEYFQTQDDLRIPRPRFEYWTAGRFAPDAVKLLEAKADTVRKYEIGWKDGSRVLNYIKRIKSRRLKHVYCEHYMNHPLARL